MMRTNLTRMQLAVLQALAGDPVGSVTPETTLWQRLAVATPQKVVNLSRRLAELERSGHIQSTEAHPRAFGARVYWATMQGRDAVS
jgi:hypothetical protein